MLIRYFNCLIYDILIALLVIAIVIRKEYEEEYDKYLSCVAWVAFHVNVLSFFCLDTVYNYFDDYCIWLPLVFYHWYNKRKRYGGITLVMLIMHIINLIYVMIISKGVQP